MPSQIPQTLRAHERSILDDWLVELGRSGHRRDDLMKEGELREQCASVLRKLAEATEAGNITDIHSEPYDSLRETLGGLSRSRVRQGFSPSEIATFVLSLKRPLFSRLRAAVKTADELFDDTWAATELLDKLALYTTEVYQKAREEVIHRQQQEMLELSTPVVKLWDGVLALPIIGTLDSARTQVVMETLLQKIVETGALVSIIDITGVPTVDTLVAQHLLKTVAAARLMGADCIISGIRPQIAQTIVHLGIELEDVITKSTLADAFRAALARVGAQVAVPRAS